MTIPESILLGITGVALLLANRRSGGAHAPRLREGYPAPPKDDGVRKGSRTITGISGHDAPPPPPYPSGLAGHRGPSTPAPKIPTTDGPRSVVPPPRPQRVEVVLCQCKHQDEATV